MTFQLLRDSHNDEGSVFGLIPESEVAGGRLPSSPEDGARGVRGAAWLRAYSGCIYHTTGESRGGSECSGAHSYVGARRGPPPVPSLYLPCTFPVPALYIGRRALPRWSSASPPSCTFPVPSLYLPCTFPVPSLYLPCT